MSQAIHNTKPPQMSEAVFNQLADVVGDLVEKAVEKALDKRLGGSQQQQLNNKRPAVSGGFKLPKADDYTSKYRAPEGD